MSSPVTRFEVLLPNVDSSTDPTSWNAINTFQTNMESLTTLYVYQVNNMANGKQYASVYGYLTSTQNSTALGYLNTLNSSLSVGVGPVMCVSTSGSSQP